MELSLGREVNDQYEAVVGAIFKSLLLKRLLGYPQKNDDALRGG